MQGSRYSLISSKYILNSSFTKAELIVRLLMLKSNKKIKNAIKYKNNLVIVVCSSLYRMAWLDIKIILNPQ